jgi:acetyl-CoA carboxylase biotin carboxyl carrier protein
LARRRSARPGETGGPGRPGPAGSPGSLSAEAIVELAVRHGLVEIEVEQGGTRIRVVREHPPAAGAAVGRAADAGAPPAPAGEPAATPSHLVPVEAPMVGTFYRAPSPDAAPFVSTGDAVKEGQVLCIIEAMKLMNEIEAKVTGRIAKVLVENGQPVEFGQPLFLVEPHH